MKHLTLALTALAATVAISPYAYATPEADELSQTNLADNTISLNQPQGTTSAPNALATNPSDTLNLDNTRRDDLDGIAASINNMRPAALDETLPRNSAGDPVLDVIVIDL
ncbi:MAG: hypothetical protein AAF215_22240 [Cyanobacteria bacterium P01_A01_bin.123]